MKRIGFPPFFQSFPMVSGYWPRCWLSDARWGSRTRSLPVVRHGRGGSAAANAGAVAVTGNGKQPHKLWKDPPLLMGKFSISMAMFNSYVKLPKGS